MWTWNAPPVDRPRDRAVRLHCAPADGSVPSTRAAASDDPAQRRGALDGGFRRRVKAPALDAGAASAYARRVEPLAAIVGAEHVRAGTEDDAVDGVVPAHVVAPADVAALQAVVRLGRPLVASGLGAHLAIGAPPRALDVLVRLGRLGDVVAHAAADMTVTVQAGCPLARLQAVLAAAGQWLPLDPPLPARTTVGGLVAANLSGPLRASQGTVRDLLLGLRWVEADGALVAGGGRVVKNVAGYDLPKLHVGALGALGVLVEATFKLRPRPAGEAALVVACRSARDAADMALAVRDATEPLWLEVAGAGGLSDGLGDGAAVAVGLGGASAEVDAAAAAVVARAAPAGCRAVRVDDGAGLRARLGAFDAEPCAALLRAATLPTDVGRQLDAAEAAARALGAAVRTVAHAASGVVRIAVARAEHVAPLAARLRPALEDAGGSLVVARAAAAVKHGLDVWGGFGAGLALMGGIKAAADPDGRLAPGRLGAVG
jgi:glycolate oxidase FAD binding subunit